jgi:hypothetical protein
MTDKPAWIEEAVEAAQEAVKQTPLNISSTRRSGQNGLRNADEVAQAVLRAFMEKVPLFTHEEIRVRDGMDAVTVRQLKEAFK